MTIVQLVGTFDTFEWADQKDDSVKIKRFSTLAALLIYLSADWKCLVSKWEIGNKAPDLSYLTKYLKIYAQFQIFRCCWSTSFPLAFYNNTKKYNEYRSTTSTSSTGVPRVPQVWEYHEYHEYHKYRSTTSTTSTGVPRVPQVQDYHEYRSIMSTGVPRV